MIKKIFSKLIKKDKTTTGVNLNSFIEDIENLLKIKCPEISFVACLFESSGQVVAIKEFREEDVPSDANFFAAYFLDAKNTIILSQKMKDVDFETNKVYFREITNAERLFFLAHELRHVWQKKYHADKFYKHNAIGMEVVHDLAEIDADAFAIAYIFSDRTPFTKLDMPEFVEEIYLQATLDGGKRWDSAARLSKELGFGKGEKIKDLKQSADCERIDQIIRLMKLNGMI